MFLPSPDGNQATITACYRNTTDNAYTEERCVYKASNVAIGGTYIYWIAIGY